MPAKTDLSFELLDRALRYEPETGLLYWKTDRGSNRLKGKIAGHLDSNGYVVIGVNYRLYKAHRIAWVLFYGGPPENEIDHKDGNSANNKISKIRDVPHSTNLLNAKLQLNNTSGIKGVSFDKKSLKWRARIQTGNQISRNLGFFASKQEAITARRAAEFQEETKPKRLKLIERWRYKRFLDWLGQFEPSKAPYGVKQ